MTRKPKVHITEIAGLIINLVREMTKMYCSKSGANLSLFETQGAERWKDGKILSRTDRKTLLVCGEVQEARESTAIYDMISISFWFYRSWPSYLSCLVWKYKIQLLAPP